MTSSNVDVLYIIKLVQVDFYYVITIIVFVPGLRFWYLPYAVVVDISFGTIHDKELKEAFI
jgi:hypothetical protein